ncbi:hypothetical protein HNQ94_000764 [Salirhabdus euzebyi]|uniref:Uncharacterized protein n=1 Tax=Salirhabdus euzebyi TaxID=394506 RepID=A0A841PU00_9BACI|nr:hypothetical protein [Salirhabdus euzebyi]MBB6452319.1 hypothetical protein [Salirhabdus euzebyi]
MVEYVGQVVQGELNTVEDEFILTNIKHLITQSVIQHKQLDLLQQYLQSKAEQKESCILTVNDQIPVKLNEGEVLLLIKELAEIQQKLS